jgi:hypothetical protein
MKLCKKCFQEKNLEEFVKSKSSPDGRWFYCKSCKSAMDKDYYAKNSEKVKSIVAYYRRENRELVKKSKKLEYQKHKEQYKKRALKRYQDKREEILEQSKHRRNSQFYKKRYARHRERIVADPGLRAIANARQRVASFMKGKNKMSRALGCSLDVFKKHIEMQFQPGMNWQNYGAWHIDHIYPLSKAYLEGPEKFKKACHYTNLQPLWAEDNVRKSAKIV